MGASSIGRDEVSTTGHGVFGDSVGVYNVMALVSPAFPERRVWYSGWWGPVSSITWITQVCSKKGGVLAKAKNSTRESSMFKDSDAANPIQLHNCIKNTSWTNWSKYNINFATKMPLFVTLTRASNEI